MSRFIPARAGLPQGRGLRVQNLKVHPRSCGVTARTVITGGIEVGSSPLVRGYPTWTTLPQSTPGFIPARAGLPSLPRTGETPGRVHPRSCGVTWLLDAEAVLSKGSSPLVRGYPSSRHIVYRPSVGDRRPICQVYAPAPRFLFRRLPGASLPAPHGGRVLFRLPAVPERYSRLLPASAYGSSVDDQFVLPHVGVQVPFCRLPSVSPLPLELVPQRGEQLPRHVDSLHDWSLPGWASPQGPEAADGLGTADRRCRSVEGILPDRDEGWVLEMAPVADSDGRQAVLPLWGRRSLWAFPITAGMEPGSGADYSAPGGSLLQSSPLALASSRRFHSRHLSDISFRPCSRYFSLWGSWNFSLKNWVCPPVPHRPRTPLRGLQPALRTGIHPGDD